METSEAEKQLLIAIGQLPGRYGRMAGFGPDPVASLENLRRFGEQWFGPYLVPWEETCARLLEEGVLEARGEALLLSARGQERRREIERQTPLHWYEYNVFFARARTSPAHSAFCREVYGEDLCQHGLADIPQLRRLLEALPLGLGERVLDLGCGNGRITAWLAQKTGARFVGVDLSEEGIKDARALPSAGALSFLVGDMNRLDFAPGTFDAALSIDTLYYTPDLPGAIGELARVVRPGGRLGLFFTQFIWEDREAARLAPDATDVALALRAHGLAYEALDLRQEDLLHWEKKRATLERRRGEFEAEGNAALYIYRTTEAERYAAWPASRRRRYLYLVRHR